MKKLMVIILFASFLTGTSLFAQQPGNFGVGARIGVPTGLSVKFWNDPNRSLDISAAWSTGHSDNVSRLLLQADYVFYNYDALDLDLENIDAPLYYGLGAQIRTGQDSETGIRIPIGIDFIFQEAPLDMFIEIAPTVNLFPSTWFEVNGGVGIHYFF